MRTVRDEAGDRYLLLAESDESSRVRDPETGEERFLPNDSLEAVDGESPLATASAAIPDAVRRILTACPDERALGLLVEIEARDPVHVRTLLSETDLCESDLHGLLGEFRAAGLIEEVEVAGGRGYEATERVSGALTVLRESDLDD